MIITLKNGDSVTISDELAYGRFIGNYWAVRSQKKFVAEKCEELNIQKKQWEPCKCAEKFNLNGLYSFKFSPGDEYETVGYNELINKDIYYIYDVYNDKIEQGEPFYGDVRVRDIIYLPADLNRYVVARLRKDKSAAPTQGLVGHFIETTRGYHGKIIAQKDNQMIVKFNELQVSMPINATQFTVDIKPADKNYNIVLREGAVIICENKDIIWSDKILSQFSVDSENKVKYES